MDVNANTCRGTVSVDYEAEWHRQIEMIIKLQDENEKLKATIIGMCESLFVKGGAE